MDKLKRGVIIGRFNPPHNGHRYLIDFAKSFVDELYIFVCTLSRDSIPGELRYEWVQELYPHAKSIHITEENPQANRQQPNAHKIWANAMISEMKGKPVDYLFASEEYGWNLARELSAEFIPVDPNRDQLPVSGTDIRSTPLKFWSFLPEVVRPYFIKRIGIFAGKDSEVIARQLAGKMKTLYAPLYRNFYNDVLKDHSRHKTIHEGREDTIHHAQLAMERALSHQANRFLFLSCHAREDGLDTEIQERKFDRLIIIESLLNDAEKTLFSAELSAKSGKLDIAAFFHWSPQLSGNIEQHLIEYFGIENDT